MLAVAMTGLPETPQLWSLVDLDTGRVWSPSAGTFVAGDDADDGLRPMVPVSGTPWAGLQVAIGPEVPELPPGAAWVVYAHDPITRSITSEGLAVSAAPRRSLAVAFSVAN